MSTGAYGPPVLEPSWGAVLADLAGRLQTLERNFVPAMYEIKLTADNEPITGDESFEVLIFAIPEELNGWSLSRASAYVSEASVTGGPTKITVRNLTLGETMVTDGILIPEGDTCGDGTLSATLSDLIVTTCDLIRVRIDEDDFGGGEAEGAGAILVFEPVTVPAGYVDVEDLPGFPVGIQLLPCPPKAALWISAGVDGPTTTTDQAQGTDPGGGGTSSISFGAEDEDADDLSAAFVTQNDVLFEGGHSELDAGLGNSPFSIIGANFVSLEADGPGRVVKSGTATTESFLARLFYLQLQGDSMVSAVGSFTLDDVGTGVTVSGLPFAPDIVFIYGAGRGGVGGPAGYFSLGVLAADDSQWAVSSAASYIQIAPGDTKAHQAVNGSVIICPPTAPGFTVTLGPCSAVGAMTGDGFTITQVDNQSSPGSDFAWIAIHDPNGEFAVGFGDMTVGQSGLAAEPEAVLVASSWATDQSAHADIRTAVGYRAARVAKGPGTNGDASLGAGVFAGGDGSDRWRSNNSDHSLVMTDAAGSIVESLDLAITSDGFTTSPSDGSFLYGWATLRGSFQGGCSGFRPQIYRISLP